MDIACFGLSRAGKEHCIEHTCVKSAVLFYLALDLQSAGVYGFAGDDPNLWRIRYQSVEEQPEPQSAPTVADAAAHITKFLKKAAGLERVIDKEYAKPKGLLSTAAKTDRIQDAKKLLVDLQSKDENTDGNDDL